MRMWKITNVAKFYLGLAVLVLCMGETMAAPIYFAGTDHCYDLVYHPEGMNWHDAKTEAESKTYCGAPGYLATVTSQAEQDFIVNSLLNTATKPYFWLGGFQPGQDPAADGNWEWVTGEPWGYTNWGAGEPSDGGDFDYEDVLQIYANGARAPLGVWNDVYGGPVIIPETGSYVIEYSVPEPATLAVLTLGLIPALLRRRRST